MAAPIFISYRRAEPNDLFAPLKRHLFDTYEKEDIYIDVEMRAGEEWTPQLEYALNGCGLMFAVIGPNWTPERLGAEDDWVRRELLKARHRGIPVVPLLLGGVDAPEVESLPRDLRWLFDPQAVSVDDPNDLTQLRRVDECVWRILPAEQTPRLLAHPLPARSRFPFSSNAAFSDREEEMKNLAGMIFSPPAANCGCFLIHGIGGVGKTQLAVEFTYRYARYFDEIFWLQLDDPARFWFELAACARAAELPLYSDRVEDQVQQLLFDWRSRPSVSRLLVLDNLEDPEFLRETILPVLRGLSLKVLITSRRPRWPNDLIPRHASIELSSFRLADSRHYMTRALHGNLHLDDLRPLDELADTLGHLPLALTLAVQYLLHHPTLTIEEYQHRLDETSLSHRSLDGWVSEMGSPTAHDLSMIRSFQLSETIIADFDTLDLFHAAAWCAPNQPIPLELLIETSRFFHPEDTEDALARLENAGLLRVEHAGAVLHPLLSRFGQIQDAGQLALRQMSAALASVTKAAIDANAPRQFAPLLPHLERVCRAADEIELENVSVLWNNLAYHYHDLAQHELALDAYQRALAADQRQYGAKHPEVASDLSNLSTLYLDMGEAEEAHETARRALRMDQKLLDKHDPQLATDYNSLGAALVALEKLKPAQRAFRSALNIDRDAFGGSHPLAARDLSNLASVSQRMGKLDEAIKHYETALLILEGIHGEPHPLVATIFNNLGDLWAAHGDLAIAWDFFERALQMDRHRYGEQHPLVALRLNNLGGCRLRAGEPARAADYFHQALVMAEEFLPADHPQVRLYRQNLLDAEEQLAE